jgi:hypothetical protein
MFKIQVFAGKEVRRWGGEEVRRWELKKRYGVSDKEYKSRTFSIRQVSEKLSNFKAHILAPRHATTVGGGKLDPIKYLNGALRLFFYKLWLKMIDHSSRSTWDSGPSGSGFQAQYCVLLQLNHACSTSFVLYTFCHVTWLRLKRCPWPHLGPHLWPQL